MQHSDTDEHSASESTRLLDNYDMSSAFVDESRRDDDEPIYEHAAAPTRDYSGLVSLDRRVPDFGTIVSKDISEKCS